jgi:predicted ATP-binding protein involved in virulence
MKTAKNAHSSSNKTMKNNMECCDATFHGIHKWYKSMYEKLGWMILSKHKGMTDKVTSYKNGLERLKWSIEHKIKMTKDYDKKEDLKIMHADLMVLIEHAEKDL